MTVSLERETALWDAGARIVAGIDEVGRGALAGPVSVGVVALGRCTAWPDGLTDSKRLTRARREALIEPIRAFAAASAVGHASADEIDAHGIVAALRLAGRRALGSLGVAVDAVLLDGTHDWLTPPAPDLFAQVDAWGGAGSGPGDDWAPPPVTMVVKGDLTCASIAGGSVLAKVERDGLMAAAHDSHPDYGWSGNKGYGAAVHLEALRRLGPSPLHRRSWRLPAREG
ncbi:ribonuclease HII [Demequina pelophila]|uniref:ribonuclease HII n=1 Tax=Demequina pelophila TaxID=1638984 RepID=UPI00078486A2|nr:ribonuclease HII [Demequina pelophila]